MTDPITTAPHRRQPTARRVRKAFLCAAAVALAALWVVPTATKERSSFMTLDPPGSVDTRPIGINDAGDIVGLHFTSDGRGHGFLLTRGVYTSIDVPGAIRTNATGVSVLKSWHRDDDKEDAKDAGADRANGVQHRDNAALGGLAVVGRYDTPDNVGHGYMLHDGVLTTIDVPDSTFSVANGINSSGHIVGRYRSRFDGRLHGFLLVDGEFTTIDYPGALHVQGMAINAKGDIAGYYEGPLAGQFHAFLLSGGVFTAIDPPGSLATGSPSGTIGLSSHWLVGYYRFKPAALSCGCDGARAFVFSDGSYTTFEIPGAVSTYFSGVNRRGDIVGAYHDGSRPHGFLLPGV